MRGLFIIAPLILAFALLTPMFVAAEISNGYTLCKLDKEVRTLRMDKESKDGKCLAVYTKNGKDQTEGEAINPSSCEEILGRIRTTLEGAGWKCRTVKESSISYVNEEVH